MSASGQPGTRPGGVPSRALSASGSLTPDGLSSANCCLTMPEPPATGRSSSHERRFHVWVGSSAKLAASFLVVGRKGLGANLHFALVRRAASVVHHRFKAKNQEVSFCQKKMWKHQINTGTSVHINISEDYGAGHGATASYKDGHGTHTSHFYCRGGQASDKHCYGRWTGTAFSLSRGFSSMMF
jgi:hypothetical protein